MAGLVALLALAGFVFAAFPGAREFVARRFAHTTSVPAESATNSQIPAAAPTGTPTTPDQPNASALPVYPDSGAPAVGTAVVPGVAVVPVQPGIAVAPAQPDNAGQPDNTAQPDNSANQGPVVIPAGTVVAVRLSDPVDSSMNQVGDKFSASVDAAVNVNGTEAIAAGADASVSLIHLAIAPIAERTDVQLQLDSCPLTAAIIRRAPASSRNRVLSEAKRK